MELFIGPDDRTINHLDFARALRKSGVVSGDTLMFHSRLFAIGKPATNNKKALLDRLIATLMEAVGPEGTLIAPTFTFSYCKRGIFDVEKTVSETGALSEAIRFHPLAARTLNPIYSVAIIGKKRDYYLESSPFTCFGASSLFDRLHGDPHVKIATLGFANPGETLSYLHYLEEKMQVPYRYIKLFKGKIIAKGIEQSQETAFYVRDLAKNVRLSWENAYDILLRDKAVRSAVVGGTFLHVVEREGMDRSITAALAANREVLAHYTASVKICQ